MAKHKRITLPNGEVFSVMNRTEAELIYREIFEDQVYALGGLQIGSGDTVVDIGANIGLFMRYALGCGENVTVYSYEPIPDTFAVLAENAAHQQGARLFNQGVSSRPGSAVFRHMPRFSCCSSMHPDDSREEELRAEDFTLNIFEKLENPVLATAIRVIPKPGRRALARAINRHYQKSVDIECVLTSVSEIIRTNQLESVDYLKIDAEGAELAVLDGVEKQHWELIRQIAIETHRGKETLERVLEIVQSRGFETVVEYSPIAPLDGMVFGRRP